MSALKLFRIGLWAMVALMAGAAVALFFFTGAPGGGNAAAPYGAPFQLVNQDGQPVTEAALRGQPSAVFFGFTHCPDVCPTTLYELAGHQAAIREAGGDFQIVFVTVDPERDTPEILKNYVASASPDILALTGEPQAVSAMLDGWGVYSARSGEGPDYTMDHTATTFLLDENGALAGTLAYGESSATAREKLENLTGV